jgi:hypothetical protein
MNKGNGNYIKLNIKLNEKITNHNPNDPKCVM